MVKLVARKVAENNLGLKSGEKFLVITDLDKKNIGQALFEAGVELGAEALMVQMKPRTRDGEEPPEPIAEMWKHVDVFVAPTRYSLTHTRARRAACSHGVRGATMPGITEEMFVRALDVDYENVVQKLGQGMSGALRGARDIRVTNPSGTDITFSVEKRAPGLDSGLYRDPGTWGNLPAGEVYVAPVEGSAEGAVVVDGSIASLGLATEPVKIEVKHGIATKIVGGLSEQLASVLKSVGRREAFNFPAEFGIGCNPAARLSGQLLEDEKVYGTVHFAFGDNSSFGGAVAVGVHLDVMVLSPTVEVDGREVIKNGRWLV